jgi:hypothetical protein
VQAREANQETQSGHWRRRENERILKPRSRKHIVIFLLSSYSSPPLFCFSSLLFTVSKIVKWKEAKEEKICLFLSM